MSLYVYAIADGLVALDNLHGVAGEPLQFVASGDGGAHAIAGDLAGAPAGLPALTAETLRAQDALVRDLAARAGALLPARFGARFADAQALRQTLDDLAPRLDRGLTRVRGREQMTIRLFHDQSLSAQQPAGRPAALPEEQPAGLTLTHDSARDDAAAAAAANDDARVGPGTRYMQRRAAEGRQWLAAIEELRAALADAIDDERVERSHATERSQSVEQGHQGEQDHWVERGQSIERAQSPVIGSIHHLIPRGSADRYLARLEEAAASARFAASGIRLRVSGPSPAYAFAEADLS
jgi:hypothetical protein